MTRRDMESTFGRFWRYQDSRITLFPLDAEQPRLGGRVQATEYAIDFRTLTPSMITYFGVYGEDFITYAEFSKDANPDDEATLLKIFEEGSDMILDKHSWKFGDDQRITYSRELNESVKDTEIDHKIEETVLSPVVRDTWSEALFYGVGNKQM